MHRKLIVAVLILLFTMPMVPSSVESITDTSQPLNYETKVRDRDVDNLTLTTVDIMGADVEIWTSDQAFEGYNLFVLRKKNVDVTGYNQTLLLTDMEGNILIEENVVEGIFELADVNCEMINSTTLLMGYQGTAALWNLETGRKKFLGFWGHHEYEYNNNDNTIFTFKYHSVEIEGNPYLMDEIREYDLDGNIVWSLDVSEFISHEWYCPYEDRFMNQPDITHSNTLFYDDDEDMIYYHPRNTNTFFKIDHATGDVIWGLGEYGDFTLIDRYGRVTNALFYHGHALEKVDDNTFIIFDNDLHNQSNQFNYRSRMIEITIDEDTMTAYESWTWTGGDDYWCHFWGDADRLPNGNRLGVFGAPTHAAGDYGARVVEVNEAGEIVWEMNFRGSDQYKWGIYRCDRIRFEPSLISPVDSIALFNEEIELTWQALYNFRSKQSLTGSYWAYVNGSLVSTGNITYDRFWRPVDVPVAIGQWSPGVYNVTLVAADEGGHTTSDTVMISVVPIYMNRVGSTHLEEGQNEYVITWTGGTIHPLICTILVDGAETTTFSWNGDDINLDLGAIGVGEHQVQLSLYNDTVEVYLDEFTLKICPNELPVFYSSPIIKSFAYGREKQLIWGVNDCAPAFRELYVDGNMISNETWEVGTVKVEWTPVDLDIGAYNITLVLIDMANHRVSDSVVLFITVPSPPMIVSRPIVEPILWGTPDVSFSWEVRGGGQWTVYKNSIPLYGGPVIDTTIGFTIHDWGAELWSVGTNEIVLKVYDSFGFTSDTLSVEVIQDPGDAYADSIVTSRSTWYSNGDNAIGEPDGVTASIFMDYGPGYMTLDMGLNEEIVNGVGDDLIIYSNGGNYSLSILQTLTSNPISIGVFSGNHSIDLDSFEVSLVRYVRLEYYNGDWVELDAIEALHHNNPSSDLINPQISDEHNLVLDPGLRSVVLEWTGSDENPLIYQVLHNGTIMKYGAWTGGAVEYTFRPKDIGIWNVTMVFFDAFGNSAYDSVLVEVSFIPSDTLEVTTLLLISGIGISALIIAIIFWYRRKST